jgi:hypothetical protein
MNTQQMVSYKFKCETIRYPEDVLNKIEITSNINQDKKTTAKNEKEVRSGWTDECLQSAVSDKW